MNRKILHVYAKDESGKFIHVNNAVKGIKYYCADPECKKEIIFRSSGKTGKGSRRPHYSHKKGTNPNCSPERSLHEGFKNELVGLLEKYRVENKPFIFNWTCGACNCKNSGNLLEKAKLLKAEYNLGECQPDIALLDKEENVLAVIEIVNTHPPEEKVLQYYKNKNITLIQIDLTSDEDSNRVEDKTKNPDSVDFCISPECQNNNKYKINRRIVCRQHRCSRCFSAILKFEIEITSVFGTKSSRGFKDDEINLIESKYKNIVRIEGRSDQGIKEKYPVMKCIRCKRMRSSRRERL
ncbi:MAG TPA: hypothetical protein PLR20_13975 [Syntrophales bacterium]|nr:hypothetical protein [Syntrophales bacterium]